MMEIVNLLSTSTLWLLAVVGLFSLLVGSFLNVVIHRLPIMMEREWKQECLEFLSGDDAPAVPIDNSRFNLVIPRSQCPHCGHQITAIENIPIISYLVLGGKCSGCKTPISAQYPLVELTTALLSLMVAWRYGFTQETMVLLPFTWILVALFMIDAKTMLLPDSLTYPLLWAGILVNFNGTFASLENSVIGAVAGYMSLWSIYQLFKLITGKEGMGFGDFKLLAAIGAWGGWQILPFVIFASSAFGALFGIAWMLVKGREKSLPMPFGPWLAMGGFVALGWHDTILRLSQTFFIPS